MSDLRTTCLSCGEELWGAGERHGLCVMCHRREEGEPYADEHIEGERDDQFEASPAGARTLMREGAGR